jgi:hypothetical protein
MNLLNVTPTTNVSTSVKNIEKSQLLIKNLNLIDSDLKEFMLTLSVLENVSIINSISGYYDQTRTSFSTKKEIFKCIGESITKKVTEYNNVLCDLKSLNVKIPDDLIKYNLKKTDKTSGGDRYEQVGIKIDENYNHYLNSRLNSKLSSIVEIANTFGFMIIPLELAKNSILTCDPKRSSEVIESAINNYKGANLERNFYILCPIGFYDFEKHVKSQKYYDVYFPSSLSMVSMNVGMNLPLFRSMYETMVNLGNRVDALENSTKVLKEQVKGIEQNICRIQSELEKISKEQIRQQQLAIQQSEHIQALKLEVQQALARREDPLLFSTSNIITDFSEDVHCDVAFAWGTEFPKQFLDMMNVKGVKKSNYWLK